jgi:arylsulfatase A-like enzyme
LRTPSPLALVFLALCGCGAGEARRAPLNLVLVSIDTLRADRLGCYGYERDTSPALDRFASRAVRFDNAFAECSWTIPSHFTMLSGLYPSSHGVTRPDRRPADALPLLSEMLHEAGYYTVALTGGGWLSERWGFGRGFDSFHARPPRITGLEGPGLERSVEQARDYMRFRRDKGPFFVFLHTYDLHCPYEPAEPYQSMFQSAGREELDARGKCASTHFDALELSAGQAAYLSDLYDGSIRELDEVLDGFFAFLEQEGFLEDSVVILTSDHGEEFGEHGGIGHEETLHVEALHVPMIVHVPGTGARVVETPVGLVDLVPTILELLGLAPDEPPDGRSFAALLRGGEGAFPTHRLAELDWKADMDSWIGADSHLIVDRETGELLFFDRTLDPDELGGAQDAARAEELRERLEAFLSGLELRHSPAEIGERPVGAELEELRRLGYAGSE